jgi:hypothetical protein
MNLLAMGLRSELYKLDFWAGGLNQPFHLQAARPKILWRHYRILKSEMRKRARDEKILLQCRPNFLFSLLFFLSDSKFYDVLMSFGAGLRLCQKWWAVFVSGLWCGFWFFGRGGVYLGCCTGEQQSSLPGEIMVFVFFFFFKSNKANQILVYLFIYFFLGGLVRLLDSS